MKVLGIETSCDETAAAIVENGTNMLSNTVASSMNLHALYGGVIPEIAARSQLESIISVIIDSMKTAHMTWQDIDAIAVTYGAGLSGSLLIGVSTAQTLCLLKNKPLIGCNHVLGHVYANFINSTTLDNYVLNKQTPRFPLLAVIVSGGHTQLVYFERPLEYTVIGKTQDDAIGEAFDKIAKLLGLPYPGGPSISKIALKGDDHYYKLPKPRMPGYDFSFSGLKTAVLRLAQELNGKDYTFPSYKVSEGLNLAQKANIAASFQRCAVDIILDKLKKAYEEYQPKSILLAGGVAANSLLRDSAQQNFNIPVLVPDIKLCTDNGAMIAALGCQQLDNNFNIKASAEISIEPNLVM